MLLYYKCCHQSLYRCGGWAQCALCPRKDGTPPIPSCEPCNYTKNPCDDRPCCRFPRPQHCPRYKLKASCSTGHACCQCNSRKASCEFAEECSDFIPRRCERMPALNCTPNLPAMGCRVTGWRPGPPATRTCPRTQYPTSPCRSDPSVPCNPCPLPRPCDRPCDARCIRPEERCFTYRHMPDRLPVGPDCQRPCNPAPPVPLYACGLIGTRRLTEPIQYKFSYPGKRIYLHKDFHQVQILVRMY